MYTLAELRSGAARAEAAGDTNSLSVINKAIEKKSAELTAAYGPTRTDSGFFENVGTGLASGAVGMYESAALGAAALLEEEAELKAGDKIKRVAESFRPDGGDKESLTYKLAAGIGSIGALLPTALLGPAALPAAAAIAGGAGAGEASERARDFGATEEERSSAAFRGTAIGLLELAPLGRIAKGLQIPGVAKVLEKVDANDLKGIKDRIRSVATTGVAEGAQEAAAAILQNLNARGYDPEAELLNAGVLDEATIGGGAGAILQALADVIAGRRGGKSIGTDGAIAEDDKSDEQAVEEVFGLPALPKVVNVVMPDGTVRENVPMDDPDAIAMIEAQKKQSAMSTEKIKGEMETDARRATERDAILGAQDREQGLASLVRDDAAGQARRQTGDLFPLEKATAEREAARVAARAPEGMSDAEMADAMAEQDAEKERAARLEDDDQIKPDGDMVDRARYEELQAKQIDERTAAEDIELAQMQREEDAAKEAQDLEAERMIVADEDKTAQSELEAQVKERGPKETQQQQPLGGMQTKSSAKKQGVKGATTVSEAERTEATAVAMAELKGIPVEEARARLAPKAPDAEAAALLATNNVPVDVKNIEEAKIPAVEGVSTAAAALVKKLTGKAVPRAKTEPKTQAPVDTSTQEAPADIGGDIEYPTAIPRGTEFTQPADVEAIDALLSKKVARSGDEKIAQTYIKRFKRPADAFEAIAFEIADKTKKFRKDGISTSEVSKFKGTGGANTEATLRWVEKNLSPAAKAEIDKRVVEQIASKKERKKLDDQRATKSADEVLTTRRDTKAAIDVDTATGGKAKVVGKSTPSKATTKAEPSPTARADKAAKKEDIVKEAVEKVQGKAKTKEPLTGDMSPAQLREKIATDTDTFIAEGGIIDVLNLELDPKVAVALDADLPAAVKALLKKGDLKGALQALSMSSKDKRVTQIARALSKNTGTTKIELDNTAGIKKRGYDTKGEEVAGLYDPAINTIILNSNLPLTVHALLHETTHAATINTLKNKSHPLTKQMNKLYEDVKPYLGTAYGTENLNEFVAEAFSNPKFQQELSKINIKGEPFSALERFYRAVTNFVRGLIGMDTKPLDSALDAADSAIMGMLSPTVGTRGGGTMYMKSTVEGVKEVLNAMGKTQKSVSSGAKKPFVDGAVNFLGDSGVKGGAKQVLLKLSGSQALGDVARAVGFGDLGLKLHASYEFMRGRIQKADQKINVVIKEYDAWFNRSNVGIEGQEALNRLVYNEDYGATVYQVDPRKPRSFYQNPKNRYDKDNGFDRLEIWDAQRGDWKILEANGGDKIFDAQRAEYKRLHEKLKDVINGEIDALESSIADTDDATKKAFNASKLKLKKQINDRLMESGELDVYFPLVRSGKYKLSFNTTITNKDGVQRVEPVFLMMDSEADQKNMKAQVEADPNTVGEVDAYVGDTKKASFNNTPPGSFVSDVLAVVEMGAPKDTAMQEQIMRLFIESLPETSFAKSLQARKGVMGYDKNVRGAMDRKGYELSSHIAKMEAAAGIRLLEKEINLLTRAPEGVDGDTFRRVKEELLVRSQFARTGATNKGTERWFQRSNQIAFIYTIGFNASSALVNLSQIPLVVLPFMSGKFGLDASLKALTGAGKFVGNSGVSIDEYYDINGGIYTLKASVEKKIRAAHDNKADADKAVAGYIDRIPLVKLANDRGQIYHSEIKDQLRAGERTSKNPALRFLDMTSAASAVMFSAAERLNRQTTLVMSYDLVLDKMNSEKKYYSARQGKFIPVPSDSETKKALAAEEALYLTQETNGGSVLETAAGYSQQGVGRVALMYKSYGLQMYYSMFKAGKMYLDNVGGKDAESVQLRKMARDQLVGVHLSALFFAGVQGVPLYGAVTMLVDMFFLDDEEDDADTLVRKYLGEGWYKGAVTELTGADIAGRVRLTGLLLQENRFNKDPSLEENIGFYLGGPALSTANRLYRGMKDLRDGEMERGLESMAPAGLTNAWRSTLGRFAREGGIQTRRGDPIYDDMTFGDFAAQALGFPPAEYTFRQEQTARNKGIEAAVTERRTNLTKKYYIALRMGDYETAQEMVDGMAEFNKRHPEAAITAETVRKSMNSHMKTSATMHNGVTVSPLMKYAIAKSNSEYRQ